MGINLDFIEIGTSDFGTLLESCLDNEQGISIEPLQLYLDKLPNRPNVKKINAAIVAHNLLDSIDTYYIIPETIDQHNLGWWMRGCNSVGKPHDFHVTYPLGNINDWHFNSNKHLMPTRNLLEEGLVTKIKVPCFTYARIIKDNDIDYVKHIKVDTEGQDADILNSILDYYLYSKKELPKSILFETNDHNDQNKSREICYRLLSLGYKLQTGDVLSNWWEDFNGGLSHDCLATLN